MLTKIKALFVLIGLILLGVWKVFAAGKKSATAEIKSQAEEEKAEVLEAGYEAANTGLIKEQKIRNEKPTTSAVDHFTS